MGLVSEKDFVLRMAQSLGTLLAHVLGLRKKHKELEALDELARGSDELLGVPRSVLDSIDATSAARLLGDPATVRTYARILQEEAEIHVEFGHDTATLRERISELTALLPT